MKDKLLGSLETQIMNYFWRRNEASNIADLHQFLNRRHTIAYTTVSTVVGRLVEKGLLKREKMDGNFRYSCCGSREDFLTRTSRKLIQNLLGNFGDIAVAGFVEELKDNPQALRKLKELSDED